jgi:hypothetical protein
VDGQGAGLRVVEVGSKGEMYFIQEKTKSNTGKKEINKNEWKER